MITQYFVEVQQKEYKPVYSDTIYENVAVRYGPIYPAFVEDDLKAIAEMMVQEGIDKNPWDIIREEVTGPYEWAGYAMVIMFLYVCWILI